jgi:hypothetical protein
MTETLTPAEYVGIHPKAKAISGYFRAWGCLGSVQRVKPLVPGWASSPRVRVTEGCPVMVRWLLFIGDDHDGRRAACTKHAAQALRRYDARKEPH